MYSYTITIGRNVGTKPMSDEDWAEFQSTVEADLSFAVNQWQAGAGQWEVHRGQGVWGDQPEDSLKVTVLLNEELPSDRVTQLRRYLGEAAHRFGQEAIALTIGQSDLVYSPYIDLSSIV